jgi:mannose-6-phosphate isomerase-like protein (cupin superfamily)
MRSRIARTSYRRAGRLVPRTSRGLRAGSVILRRDEAMGWHSTGRREELVILLAGRVRLDVDTSAQIARWSLRAGECAFIPPETPHRVVNRSRTLARYLYVTAPTP